MSKEAPEARTALRFDALRVLKCFSTEGSKKTAGGGSLMDRPRAWGSGWASRPDGFVPLVRLVEAARQVTDGCILAEDA